MNTKRFAVLIGLFLTPLFAASARADLFSLLAASNKTNDSLQVTTWGVWTKDTADPPNGVVFALGRVQLVNGQKLGEKDSAWFVYSAQLEEIEASKTPLNRDGYLGSATPTTCIPGNLSFPNLYGNVPPYSQNALLIVFDNVDTTNPALAHYMALLEKPVGSDEFVEGVLKGAHSIQQPDEGAGTPVASFGLNKEKDDFFFVGQPEEGKQGLITDALSGLSVVWTAEGVSADSFLPLLKDEWEPALDLSQFQLAFDGTMNLEKSLGDKIILFGYTGEGTILMNHVPEPMSLVGLASLALTAGGLGFIRRRK